MADDTMLREMTSDPKFRKVLVTDGKTAVGQALVQALVKAGAEIVWVGHAEPWKKLPGIEDITKLKEVTLVPLDLTNGRSVTETRNVTELTRVTSERSEAVKNVKATDGAGKAISPERLAERLREDAAVVLHVGRLPDAFRRAFRRARKRFLFCSNQRCGAGRSSRARTFRAKSIGINGFCRYSIPVSRTPWWTTAFSVYPDMNSTRRPGRAWVSFCATCAPPSLGSTTSVTSKSIVPS